MKQVTFITAPKPESVRLWLASPFAAEKQTNLENQNTWLYQGLIYQLNKEDEFDKTLYWEEDEDNESEDDFDNEEESTRNNNEEDYEFDYHRHK